ncbi:MAG: IclR family transcriptional regulator [Thermodesulfobacteriota bacterium]
MKRSRTGLSLDPKYRIKVLEKAFRVLELFDDKAKELTTTEIQGQVGLNKTSTFRIIKNLEEFGYLEKDPETLKYRLGIKVYYLGSLVQPYVSLRKVARPLLQELNRRTQETVHLAVLNRGQSLYLEKLDGQKTIRVMTSIGAKLPAHCSGVGKVLLAGLPQEEVQAIIAARGLQRFTVNTITGAPDLQEELERVRRQGYATDNEEIELGLKCAAAPVFINGRTLAAVSVSVPKDRFDQQPESFVGMVKDTAQEISRTLAEMELARAAQPRAAKGA